MWYKIPCWKPENNSQLLFSALHLQSSSALGSWWALAFGQKVLRPCPGAREVGKEARVKVDTTCQLILCCIQQVTLPPGKAIQSISQQRPQHQWQTISTVWPGSSATGTTSGASRREAGLFFQPFLCPAAEWTPSKLGSTPWCLTPLGWHPEL